MANRMLMVTIVRPIAISGEISAIAFDRSARFSSTNCMSRVLLLQTAPAHQQTELLAVGIRGRQRFGEAAVEHHRDPVGDLDELVQVLARYQHGGTACGEIEQGLPDHRGRACVHPPSRLADHKDGGITQYFAADDELLQIAAGQACRSPESAASSSSCPVPATPAMPRISPPFTSGEMCLTLTP